jgi:SAM-dependent methyltransferase
MSDKSSLDKSAVISYWDNKPCNSGHSKHPVGSKEFHDQVSAKRYFVEPHILDFAGFAEFKNQKVLEIGAGIGTDAFHFARNGAIVRSGDISPNSIKICEMLKKNLELKNVSFFQHDFESPELPIGNDFSPDLIYSFGVVHHTPDPLAIFQNFSKWGRPGTKVKVMVYSRFSTKAIALFLRYGYRVKFNFDRAVALQSEAQFGSPYTYTYTFRSIRKIFEASDMKITKIYKRHIFDYQVKPYKNSVYKKRFYWKLVPDVLKKKLEKILGWHLLVEAVIL